ncbi:hypothetical protein [Pseudopontixanthobacter vadosimaris]|uniref:hypothetical protein n=1 Tax=Pseudopontixanthobacter vadosimaris TaxID=2726450 RepID=UPI001475F529|nr:hypothetical protein [Pseudopontixanthobacter vadosimaris]
MPIPPENRQGALARQFVRPGPHPNHSVINYLRWLATSPRRTRVGADAIARHVGRSVPDRWRRDFAGKHILVVGSGPSLDRVAPDFFAPFDTILYINFALRRRLGHATDYFFSTDGGPIGELIAADGPKPFRDLGTERSLFAPIFPDQWGFFTPAGRDLFTWLRADAYAWRTQPTRIGPFRLPLVLHYHPVQPDWAGFTLGGPSRSMPVLDDTSAFTAVLFAAMQGAERIGLIGCDLTAGRAASVHSEQITPDVSVFAGAAPRFRLIASALARQGVAVTNHSWDV